MTADMGYAGTEEGACRRLIDEGRAAAPGPGPDGDHLAGFLVARPSNGPVAEAAGCAERLSEALYRLDRREYGEEPSSDAFLCTRAAVVAADRAAYEEVPADPVLFGPCAEEPIRAEPLFYVPDRAYGNVIGRERQRDTRYPEEPIWAEPLLYVPDRAYGNVTGRERQRDTRYSYESHSNREGRAEKA
ncbi:hypothetical protein [Nocardiopsis sp. CC223A]|uniref:hypothetical protein n=1 Tax=Nocardiopsis sp. CC223A TaxID=3044051 RepID=UPI00278BB9CB|nr:hypothetical protein [Nocardiopsis sp. CC223A]